VEREKNAAERLIHRFSPSVVRPLSFSLYEKECTYPDNNINFGVLPDL